jgi:hypothetical protein
MEIDDKMKTLKNPLRTGLKGFLIHILVYITPKI